MAMVVQDLPSDGASKAVFKIYVATALYKFGVKVAMYQVFTMVAAAMVQDFT
jgi:hypothetical protein